MGNVVITGTGPLYSLEEVKQFLNVDFADDDTLIQSFMDAAENAVLQYCNLSLVPEGKQATFKIAAMMAVEDFYEKRGASDGLPRPAMLLIDPYRWLRV